MKEIDKTNLTGQNADQMKELRLKIILSKKLTKEKYALKNEVNMLLPLIT